jgi:phage-related protein
MAGPIRIAILADAGKAKAEIGDTESKLSKLGSGMGKLRAPALAVGAGFLAAGAGLLKLAQGAAEDERAQATLAKTLRNTAGATDAQVASIEAYISKVGAATGVTDDEMRPALANLVRATKDVGKAQSLMGLAMDISAGTGKDLGSVTMALAKAQNGSVGGLAKLGIATKDASGKTKSFAQIQKDLAKTFGGQASAAANTLEGKQKRLKLTLAELGEEIGAKLLPVLVKVADFTLNKIVPAFEAALGWASRNKTTLGILAGVVGGLAGVILLVNGAMAAWGVALKIAGAAVKAYTIVQAALNLVMSLNPIGLVVIAIAALAAGVIWAWRNVDGFKTGVTKAFEAVKNAVLTVVDFVVKFFKDNWKKLPLLLLGPVGIMVFIFKALPGKIQKSLGNTAKTLLSKGKDLVVGLAKGVYNNVLSLITWWVKLPGKIAGWLGDTAKSLVSKGANLIIGLARGVYNNVVGLVTWWVQLPGKIAGWLGDTLSKLVSKGKGLIVGLARGVYNNVSGLVTWWVQLPGKILGWLGNVGSTLWDAGKNILQGLIDGIESKIQALKDKLSGITKLIPDVKGPLSKDKKLLTPAGKAIMGGLIGGMDAQIPKLRKFLTGVTSTIEGVDARPSVAFAASVAADRTATQQGHAAPFLVEVPVQIGNEVVKVVRLEIDANNRRVKRSVTAGASRGAF